MGKKLFFQSDLKKTSKKFRNADIYVDMGYSELDGHSKTLLCCGGA